MEKLSGTIVNVVTPMKRNGRVSFNGIDNLFRYLSRNDVGGFWFLGSAGEDFNIGIEDRMLAINQAIESNKSEKNLPLILGLGPSSFFEIKELIKKFDSKDVGFSFLNYDQKISGKAKLRYIEKICDLLKKSKLWLYHNPKRGSPFTIKEIKYLKLNKKIAGLKSGGYDHTFLMNSILLNDTNFQVAGAGGGQAYTMYCLGAKAHMTSDANCWPELHNKLYKCIVYRDFKKAMEVQKKIIKINKLMPKTENGENSAAEKFLLSQLGVCEEFCNPSFQKLTVLQKNKITKIIKDFKLK